MARAYSAAFKSTLSGTSAPESPLILLEINQASLASPIRVVADTQDITSNGNVFTAAPFRCLLPDDFENQLPRARLAIDNIGQALMYWIEASVGAAGTTVRFMQVMRSRPDLIEWEITMSMFNMRATFAEISGELGFENLLQRPAIAVTYRPETSPGLF